MDLEAEGKILPEGKRVPELYFDAVPFWQAFSELSSSRPVGMAVGSIPYSEISAWMNENDIRSFEERQRYRYFINFIDSCYLSKSQDVSKAKSKGK